MIKLYIKKPIAVFSITVLVALGNYSLAQTQWKKEADVSFDGRGQNYHFAINGKIYVGGGSSTGTNSQKYHDWNEYDIATKTWTSKGNIANSTDKRYGGVSFAINGKGYIVSGGDDNNDPIYKDVYEYDGLTDKWTKKADFPGQPIQDATSFVVGGKGYIVGGVTASTFGINEVWEYAPNNDKWTKKANFPEGMGLYANTAFTHMNSGYITGGRIRTGIVQSYANKHVYEYNTTNDKWTKKVDSFPGLARNTAVAYVRGDKAYFGLGVNANRTNVNNFYEYDIVNDKWGTTPVSAISGDTREHAVLETINGVAYLGTGANSAPPNNFNDWYTLEYAVGVNEIAASKKVNIYPNPATSVIYIISEGNLNNYTYQLINNIGTLAKSGMMASNKIDVADLPNGLYFLILTNDKNEKTHQSILITSSK